MRLFLGIELEPAVRTGVLAVQTRLSESGGDVRWSASDNLHLTVLFLGEHTPPALAGIEEASSQIAAETEPFRIRVGGTSAFPKRGPLKTLFVGLTEGVSEWMALVERAEPWFAPMGVARHGGLVPHVTLGRVRSDRDDAALRSALAQEARAEAGVQTVAGMVLIESFLDQSGAQYQNRGFYPFKKTENQIV